MDYYLLLRLVHIIGFISLGGGLLAVFVSELRAYRTADVNGFAEAAWYTATFYDALVAPGAVLVGLSGLFLIFELGIGFLSEPWLVGMWGLFLFEFIEGNTVHSRTIQANPAAFLPGARSWRGHRPRSPRSAHVIGRVTHFLDLPLFLAIVCCGAMRPGDWTHVLGAIVSAVSPAAALTVGVPKLVRHS